MGEIHPALELPAEYKLGPAMKALNEKQRAFVVALIECGGMNYTRAALAAGYGNGKSECAAVTANRLAHDDTILEAIHEEAHRRLRSGSIMSVQTLLDIANDATAENKDRLKAVEMILNRAGMPAMTEHHVHVKHTDNTEVAMIARIKLLAEKQGLDPAKLLGSAGVTIDAEFKEVKDTMQELVEESEKLGLYNLPEDSLADIL